MGKTIQESKEDKLGRFRNFLKSGPLRKGGSSDVLELKSAKILVTKSTFGKRFLILVQRVQSVAAASQKR